MKKVTVSAVLVTYNRINLLKQSIQKILNQNTEALKHLIIVDGASTDGTQAYLKTLVDDRISTVYLSKNLGGAGGFNAGIRQFYEKTTDDFVWVMDDDSMPEEDALEKLLEPIFADPMIGWCASKVVWTDKQWAKMNVPGPIDGDKKRIFDGGENILAIKHATFVSTIFKRELVEKIGLPQKEYFIWGDDIEYTERASREMPGYLVRRSIVVHASKYNANPGDIVSEKTQSRLPRYLYEYRNRLLTARRRQSVIKYVKTLGHTVLDFLKTLILPSVQYRRQKLSLIIKGTVNGFKFNPPIEYL